MEKSNADEHEPLVHGALPDDQREISSKERKVPEQEKQSNQSPSPPLSSPTPKVHELSLVQTLVYILPFMVPKTFLQILEFLIAVFLTIGSRASSFLLGLFIKTSIDGLMTQEPESMDVAFNNAVTYLAAHIFTDVLNQTRGILKERYIQHIKRRFSSYAFSRLIHHPLFVDQIEQLADIEKDSGKESEGEASSPKSKSKRTSKKNRWLFLLLGDFHFSYDECLYGLLSLTEYLFFDLTSWLSETCALVYFFYRLLGSPSISIIVFVTVVVYCIVQARCAAIHHRYSQRQRRSKRAFSLNLIERLYRCKHICAHGMTQREFASHDNLLDRSLKEEITSIRVSRFHESIMSLILEIGMTSCFLVTGYSAINKELSVGDFSLVATYISSLFYGLLRLSSFFSLVVSSLTNIRQLVEILMIVEADGSCTVQGNIKRCKIIREKETQRSSSSAGSIRNDDASLLEVDEKGESRKHEGKIDDIQKTNIISPISPDIVGVELRNVSFEYRQIPRGCGCFEYDSEDESDLESSDSGLVENEQKSEEEVEATSPDSEEENKEEGNGGKYNGVKNISFSARPGEPIGLVGMSGSGKSTILNLILGLRKPQEGQIFLDGEETPNDLPLWERLDRNKNIGSLLQNIEVVSKTVRDNMTFYLESAVSDERLWKALEKVGLKEKVESMDGKLDAQVGEDGYLLSGGERQRLAISRLLVRDFHIIVTDEATASLSALDEKVVTNSLREISRQSALIMVAHRLKTVAFAKEILVLQHGEIAERGSHEQLLEKNGLYKEMWDAQMGRDGV